MHAFKESLCESLSKIKESISSFSLSECVKKVLDKFVPIKTRLITIRPAAPWINIFVKAQKQARRKAERVFKKTGLAIHKEILKYHKIKQTKLLVLKRKNTVYFRVHRGDFLKNVSTLAYILLEWKGCLCLEYFFPVI